MGDGADMALDNAFDDMEHYERFKDAPLFVQYEEGLIDEMGATIGEPWSGPFCKSDQVAYRKRQQAEEDENQIQELLKKL